MAHDHNWNWNNGGLAHNAQQQLEPSDKIALGGRSN